MELRYITTFIRIVELNSFTKAADSLGYTQAAVTAQVRQLENELDTRLFDRLGKNIALTDDGRAFLDHAIRIQQAEAEAIASIRGRNEMSGQLTIGSISSVAAGLMPALTGAFLQEYPDIRIRVRIYDDLNEMHEHLKKGDIDFMYFIDEDNYRPDCSILGKWKEAINFVTASGSPLADGRKASLAEICSQPLLVTDSDRSYSLYLRRMLDENGLDFNPVLDTGSVTAIVEMLAGGFGVSYLPQFMVAREVGRGTLSIINADMPEAEVYRYLMCHRNKYFSPCMKAFRDFVLNWEEL